MERELFFEIMDTFTPQEMVDMLDYVIGRCSHLDRPADIKELEDWKQDLMAKAA